MDGTKLPRESACAGPQVETWALLAMFAVELRPAFLVSGVLAPGLACLAAPRALEYAAGGKGRAYRSVTYTDMRTVASTPDRQGRSAQPGLVKAWDAFG